MRKPILLAAAVAGAAALWTMPASAAQGIADPGDAGTLLIRTADTKTAAASAERKRRPAGVRRYGVDEYWHDRLEAGRWLHYQHVNAGYPARRYVAVAGHGHIAGACGCGHGRHWPWIGRTHWHGARYWMWIGHRRHHHHH